MSQNGYDQFFKAAKQQKAGNVAPSKAKRSKKNLPKPKATLQKKSKKASSKAGVIGSIASIVTVIIALVGIFSLDKGDDFLSSIEVGMFSQANAVGEAASKLAAKVKKGAKSSSSSKNTDKDAAAKPQEKIEIDKEELSYLSKLRERKTELDQKEKALVELESRLQEQKKMLDKKISELTKVRDEIASVLKDRIDYDDDKISTLVDFYSNMKPQQAAQIFEEINEDLAVEVLGRMKKKNAANIMNLLKPAKAQTLSEKFAGYQK